jgi:lycopene cyclase domain-containing protein
MTEYYYLFLNLFSILCPIVLSFDKNVRYITKWKYAVISIIASFIIFLPWDLYFHHRGVWWFNEKYTLGLNLFGLPLEENIFFVAIPFACIFVLECVRYYLPKFVQKVDVKLNWVWLVVFNLGTIALLIIYWDKLYSFTVFGLSILLINFSVLVFRNYIALCFVSLLFIFIPFLLINGALTGGFTTEPVVLYSNDYISGIRIWTIPIEDFFYNTLMMISLFFFYFAWQKLVLKKEVL